MSEEKPTFKVTDRRLFNPDGTPREIEHEPETPAPTAQGASDAEASATAAEAQGGASARPAEGAEGEHWRDERGHDERGRDERGRDERAESAARSGARGASEDERGAGEGRAGREQRRGASQADEEGDPTAFANLVMFIASPAAAAMGMTEHPGMQPGELDLPLARHCIDLLVTLREKARGNLGAQEQQILESLLAELQMQYVSLTSARRPSAPRGFTGSDITGGR